MGLLYLITIRLIHILASVCWAGGAFTLVLFIEPTGKDLGPAGMGFIQHMVAKKGFSTFMGIVSTLTVVTGILLVWENAAGNWLAWMTMGPGLVFTVGSIVGLIVYGIGMLMVKPRGDRLGELGKEVAAAGGAPTPAQEAELERLGRELSALGRLDFVLIALSLAMMAVARYWLF